VNYALANSVELRRAATIDTARIQYLTKFVDTATFKISLYIIPSRSMIEAGRRAAMLRDAAAELADFTALHFREDSVPGETRANRDISSLAARPASSVLRVLGLAATQRRNAYV
jgi:hypothetical protein